jgi:uncharacterized membrane protein YdjX (TVP38/TMEM64 family)
MLASITELLSIFLGAFGLNLVPFASPSNLFIAANAAVLVNSDPFTIGVIVALASALAKLIHYGITFFIGKHFSETRRQRLDAKAPKVRKWAFPMLFIAAASPIPDEPVVVPLGLIKYNPVKFFLAFFSGKLSITLIGAYMGVWTEGIVSPLIGQLGFTVASVVLTVIVTVIMLKVDVEKFIKTIRDKLCAPRHR